MITRTKLKNLIYEATKDITSHLYTDEYWHGVSMIRIAIEDLIDEYNGGYYLSMFVNDGGYCRSKDGMSQWKEYIINIYSDDSDTPVIQGTLNCHAAGTVADPFSAYDMSLVLYLNNE